MWPDQNENRGIALLEAIAAVALLGIISGFIIQSMAASIRNSERVRDSFEASLLLENLLFDVKSDERGQTYARSQPHEAALKEKFMTPNTFTYRVQSNTLGTVQRQFGDHVRYDDFNIRVNWKDGRDFVSTRTVLRIQYKPEESH